MQGYYIQFRYLRGYVALLLLTRCGRLAVLGMLLLLPLIARAQSPVGIRSFGTGFGGTVPTSSLSSPSILSQYHLYVEHGIGNALSGEINVGLLFLADPSRRSRIIDFEYRLRYPLFGYSPQTASGRFSSYFYGGAGIGRFQRLAVDVQNDPMVGGSDPITNTSLWNNGRGWALLLPMGLGAEYRLDAVTALRITAGYQLLVGSSVLRDQTGREGLFGATVGLSFRPFDHMGSPEVRQGTSGRTHVAVLPDSLDSDGDGLGDRDELLVYHSDPRLIDTDGDLVADGREVQQQTDLLKRPAALPTPAHIPAVELPSAKVAAYRFITPLYYTTLEYKWNKEGKTVLQRVLQMLQSDPKLMIRIVGYADPRGHGEMNRTLSNLRSWYAYKYFVEQGITADRLYGTGYGEVDASAGQDVPTLRQSRRTVLQLDYTRHSARVDHNDHARASMALQPDGDCLVASSRIIFERYSDKLNPEALSELDALLQYLKDHKAQAIHITGYGDPNGSLRLNRMLGEARSAAVAKYLIDRGISIERLQTGAGRPADRTFQTVTVEKIEI